MITQRKVQVKFYQTLSKQTKTQEIKFSCVSILK